MAPSVAKRKTAFQFFQAENIGKVKKELGIGATMGSAMTEVSLFITFYSFTISIVFAESFVQIRMSS